MTTPTRPAVGDAERAVATFLRALGQELDGELAETPARVAATFADLLTPRPFDPTVFRNDDGSADLVELSELPFASLCEHHLLPFHGTVRIAYRPADRIAGFSTFAHVVDHFSRSLQLQERFTAQIADWIAERLEPRGVEVVVEATQLCMAMRGSGTLATRTTTSAVRGDLGGR